MRGYISWFSPRFAWAAVQLARRRGFRPFSYLAGLWHTSDITDTVVKPKPSITAILLVIVMQVGMIAQFIVAGGFVGYGLKHNLPVFCIVGSILLLIAPIVWAHILFLFLFVVRALSALLRPKVAIKDMKAAGKHVLCMLLENQVIRLRSKHAFKVVAVAGSVGKTSTKLAVVSVLKSCKLVQFQDGNYNDRLTVPLVFFGVRQPALYNIVAWLSLLITNEFKIYKRYPYDFVVVELGTDGIGQMERFAYLKPELTILSAIAPEHMEQFGSLDAVAAEELKVASYSKQLLVNIDDAPAHYLAGHTYLGYGFRRTAHFKVSNVKAKGLGSQSATFALDQLKLAVTVQIHGKQGARVSLAAAAAGYMLGLTKSQLEAGIASITSQPGRMNILQGIRGATIIDDSYNASPLAVKAALDVLYSAKATQRIAVLGSMNEMGEYAKAAHEEIGAYCDPKKLTLVVTIGLDAREMLAPAAMAKGCAVESFMSPYEAGEYVLQRLEDKAVILVKGSQNRVFTEESIKPLLANPKDIQKLVRQSAQWIAIKSKQFL